MLVVMRYSRPDKNFTPRPAACLFSMIARISERHEPQLVPARSVEPIASRLSHPEATADASWLAPTWKQAHTTRPMAGIGTGDRPDRSA